MAIRDWRVLIPAHSVTGPLGDPFAANRLYLQAFYALESMAFARMTHRELLPWCDCLNTYSSRDIALAELARREQLESEAS